MNDELADDPLVQELLRRTNQRRLHRQQGTNQDPRFVSQQGLLRYFLQLLLLRTGRMDQFQDPNISENIVEPLITRQHDTLADTSELADEILSRDRQDRAQRLNYHPLFGQPRAETPSPMTPPVFDAEEGILLKIKLFVLKNWSRLGVLGLVLAVLFLRNGQAVANKVTPRWIDFRTFHRAPRVLRLAPI
jgi:hypothetical protein